MAKSLVIVESPTKAKTLKRYLGDDFVVDSSVGHVRDLPRSRMSVDVEKDFEPVYEVVEGKSKTISKLKKEAKGAKTIYLAMDPDREGEAIAFHVRYILEESKKSKKKPAKDKYQRVTFHEITKDAILHAMEEPGTINMDLVDAQQARRILDRLVGYSLSPVLWRKVRRGLSAGRVQSVALRLIVEKEKEIGKFKAQEYWEISSKLKAQNSKLKGKGKSFDELRDGEFIVGLRQIEGKRVVVKGSKEDKKKDVVYLDSKKVVTPVEADLKKAKYVIEKIVRKERKKAPYPPFTTSTLQQAAANVMGWSGKMTMRIAQQLYEAGLITYHRTDSLNLSASAISAGRKYIESEYGKNYLSQKARVYKTKSKSAQEAHEAIRPTNPTQVSAEGVSGKVTPRHEKLYKLVRDRFLACQMASAIYDQTTVDVTAKGKKTYSLRAVGSVVKFDGWRKLQNKKAVNEVILPELADEEKLDFVDLDAAKKETLPPPRYNDASLIKELEKRGIGRPSTYASIISVLVDRGYVEREERRFYPTAVGETVVKFLKANFSDVMDYDFTAEMEDDLDAVAAGKKDWRKMMKDFWGPFDKEVEAAKEVKRVKVPVEQTGRKCPGEDGKGCEHKGDLVIRSGRFGKFISCDKFPECKYTEKLVEKLKGFKCPECGGDVVIKKTRKGRSFYGCNNYPKCEYASWKDPRKEDEQAKKEEGNKKSKSKTTKKASKSKKASK